MNYDMYINVQLLSSTIATRKLWKKWQYGYFTYWIHPDKRAAFTNVIPSGLIGLLLTILLLFFFACSWILEEVAKARQPQANY